MDAGGGERQDRVAGGDVAPRQYVVALDGADGKAGEVEVLAGVHAGHFGGLAADQRAPAWRQPSAMPATIRAPASGSSLPVAK